MVTIGLFFMLYYWTLCRIGAEADSHCPPLEGATSPCIPLREGDRGGGQE